MEDEGGLLPLLCVVGLICAALSDDAPTYFVGLCAVAGGLVALLLILTPVMFALGMFKRLFDQFR